jgi:hypothetical protein
MGANLVISARQTFDPVIDPVRVPGPGVARTLAGRVRRELRPVPCVRMLLSFYRDPLAWFGLVVSLAILAYAGGAVMFILHAEVLGEQGPAIPAGAHWLLDSTLGFIGLAPAVALILPLASWAATPAPGDGVRPAAFAAVGGVMFAFATGPGPIAHDLLVGRGTWLANQVTGWISGTAPLAAHVHGGDGVSQALSIGLQVAVGVPTYTLLVWASLAAVRGLLRQRRALQRAREVLAG